MAIMCNLLREKFSRTEMTVELDVESLEYYVAEHLKGMGEQESAYFQMIVGDILSMTQKRPEYNPDFWKSGLPKENGKYSVPMALKFHPDKIIVCTTREHATRPYLNPLRLFRRAVKDNGSNVPVEIYTNNK